MFVPKIGTSRRGDMWGVLFTPCLLFFPYHSVLLLKYLTSTRASHFSLPVAFVVTFGFGRKYPPIARGTSLERCKESNPAHHLLDTVLKRTQILHLMRQCQKHCISLGDIRTLQGHCKDTAISYSAPHEASYHKHITANLALT
jgi:hypothetical protein